MERLKRELSRNVREASPLNADDQIYQDRGLNGSQHHSGIERYDSGRPESREVGYQRARSYMGSPSEEKENGSLNVGAGKKPSTGRPLSGDTLAAGRGDDSGGAPAAGQGVDSYKRAAEVTSQLKARIEQMKVSTPFCYHPFGVEMLMFM
jgi:cytoskeleton-associated protein 5